MSFLEQQNKITTNSIKGTIEPISKSIVGEYYSFYGTLVTTINCILLCALQFHR